MTRPDPLAVACPFCGSDVGIPCCYHPIGHRKPKFYSSRAGYHAARVRATEQKEKEESRATLR